MLGSVFLREREREREREKNQGKIERKGESENM
jgi:hypothetical protein